MTDITLIRKYNVPGPRYTSYPTVPYWDEVAPSQDLWKSSLQKTFQLYNDVEGISLYVHLPYCESLCTYCGCTTRITKNHAVEKPYIAALLEEWAMVVNTLGEKPSLRELHLGGGTPTFFAPEHLELLISGLLHLVNLRDDFEFGFEGHPNNTTIEHLETLHKLGFRRISLGIQDFDPVVQDIVNRFQSVESVENVTRQAREIGFTSVNYDLIYGLPMQTSESVRRTVEEVVRLRPDRIAFYSYAHVPWIKPGQRKFTELDLPDDETKRGLYELGRTMLENTGYHEIGMDHFALATDSLYESFVNRNMHRNFMGYTSSMTHLLVGLGASAISDAWVAFVQNEKKVEDYIKAIDERRMPFFRGHELTEEDLVIRRHILDIMCSFETTWQEEYEQCEALYDGISRLDEMVADGLVEIEPFRLRVTDKGKAFVRNICMAFDARLWGKQPVNQLFSKTV